MLGLEIQKLILEKGITKKELARRCGWSQNNLGNKLKRDNLTEKDMRKISDALGYKLEINFVPKQTEQAI